MKRILGTEFIIENTLKLLDIDPFDDLGDWPADAELYKGMRLSDSKMRNEVSLREPGTTNHDGSRQSYPLLGTETGTHSTDKRNRLSDIEELGEGTNLYFKFLKYFMGLFVFCTILSLPAIFIFISGGHFDGISNPIKQYMGVYTLGNLGSSLDTTCSSATLPQTSNDAGYISFKCPRGMTIANLQQFGMAYNNQTCTGFGVDRKVRTIRTCSLGSMD